MSILEERLPWLETFVLDKGAHAPDGKACIMEAAAYIAGEQWSDHPKCVSPVIAAFCRSWNDSLPDEDRDRLLRPYITKVIGTRTTKRDEEIRAWMATDWLARECAPAFLRLAGLIEHAEKLEGLAAITTTKRAEKAQPALRAAEAAAWDAARAAAGDAAGAAAGAAAWDAAEAAAWDAAGAAAWDAARAAARAAAWDAAEAAAWDAAGAAAWDAAGAAAGAAAWDAARAAAWDAAEAAAWDAAGAAAWDALEPTVKILQPSALLLLDRMIEVGKK